MGLAAPCPGVVSEVGIPPEVAVSVATDWFIGSALTTPGPATGAAGVVVVEAAGLVAALAVRRGAGFFAAPFLGAADFPASLGLDLAGRADLPARAAAFLGAALFGAAFFGAAFFAFDAGDFLELFVLAMNVDPMLIKGHEAKRLTRPRIVSSACVLWGKYHARLSREQARSCVSPRNIAA